MGKALNAYLIRVLVPLVDFARLARGFQSRVDNAINDYFSNALLNYTPTFNAKDVFQRHC
jgi:hypothetical protein